MKDKALVFLENLLMYSKLLIYGLAMTGSPVHNIFNRLLSLSFQSHMFSIVHLVLGIRIKMMASKNSSMFSEKPEKSVILLSLIGI